MTDTAKARNYNGLTEDNLLLFFQGFIINLSIDFITNLSRDLLLGVVIKKVNEIFRYGSIEGGFPMPKFSKYPSLKALEVYNWKIHKQAGAELCQAQSKLELFWL